MLETSELQIPQVYNVCDNLNQKSIQIVNSQNVGNCSISDYNQLENFITDDQKYQLLQTNSIQIVNGKNTTRVKTVKTFSKNNRFQETDKQWDNSCFMISVQNSKLLHCAESTTSMKIFRTSSQFP
ncbi:Hypothetical_protein [Hexamita inflata]|uniref:Hypothetical_protein n=1 Tax=Hexamita inflata TaxID=28002 RepID=A0AA86UUZ2_9EUKA|nr:Hypothetical protein HINF_LOCUS53281 [Hexamita inflata]